MWLPVKHTVRQLPPAAPSPTRENTTLVAFTAACGTALSKPAWLSVTAISGVAFLKIILSNVCISHMWGQAQNSNQTGKVVEYRGGIPTWSVSTAGDRTSVNEGDSGYYGWHRKQNCTLPSDVFTKKMSQWPCFRRPSSYIYTYMYTHIYTYIYILFKLLTGRCRRRNEAGAPRRGRGREGVPRRVHGGSPARAPALAASLGYFWYRRRDLSTQPRKAWVTKTQNKTNGPPQNKTKTPA